MTSNEILHADLLDIVFDNRNKAYGAYTLRKFYNNRLCLALGIALTSTLLLLLMLPSHQQESRAATDSGPVVTLTQIELPPPRPQLPPPPLAHPAAPKAPVNTIKLTNMIHMSVDPNLKTDIPDLRNLDQVAIASAAIKGGALSGPQLPALPPGNGSGTTSETDKQGPGAVIVDQMPEFPGGMNAWLAFLRKNLQVPDELETGEKKNVLVAFKVAADGSITGFRVVQSAGSVFDNEVIRVLKKMPKWKPALQHGTPIAVEFTQPVTFVGSEQ